MSGIASIAGIKKQTRRLPWLKRKMKCFRCGRYGHFIRNCYATTTYSGEPLTSGGKRGREVRRESPPRRLRRKVTVKYYEESSDDSSSSEESDEESSEGSSSSCENSCSEEEYQPSASDSE
jgi:Zinc knuckle